MLHAGGGTARFGRVNRGFTAPSVQLTINSAECSLLVSFDASATVTPDFNIVKYTWLFGDGTPALETSTPTTTHTYSEYGSYSVVLTVETDNQIRARTAVAVGLSCPDDDDDDSGSDDDDDDSGSDDDVSFEITPLSSIDCGGAVQLSALGPNPSISFQYTYSSQAGVDLDSFTLRSLVKPGDFDSSNVSISAPDTNVRIVTFNNVTVGNYGFGFRAVDVDGRSTLTQACSFIIEDEPRWDIEGTTGVNCGDTIDIDSPLLTDNNNEVAFRYTFNPDENGADLDVPGFNLLLLTKPDSYSEGNVIIVGEPGNVNGRIVTFVLLEPGAYSFVFQGEDTNGVPHVTPPCSFVIDDPPVPCEVDFFVSNVTRKENTQGILLEATWGDFTNPVTQMIQDADPNVRTANFSTRFRFVNRDTETGIINENLPLTNDSISPFYFRQEDFVFKATTEIASVTFSGVYTNADGDLDPFTNADKFPPYFDDEYPVPDSGDITLTATMTSQDNFNTLLGGVILVEVRYIPTDTVATVGFALSQADDTNTLVLSDPGTVNSLVNLPEGLQASVQPLTATGNVEDTGTYEITLFEDGTPDPANGTIIIDGPNSGTYTGGSYTPSSVTICTVPPIRTLPYRFRFELETIDPPTLGSRPPGLGFYNADWFGGNNNGYIGKFRLVFSDVPPYFNLSDALYLWTVEPITDFEADPEVQVLLDDVEPREALGDADNLTFNTATTATELPFAGIQGKVRESSDITKYVLLYSPANSSPDWDLFARFRIQVTVRVGDNLYTTEQRYQFSGLGVAPQNIIRTDETIVDEQVDIPTGAAATPYLATSGIRLQNSGSCEDVERQVVTLGPTETDPPTTTEPLVAELDFTFNGDPTTGQVEFTTVEN